MNPTHIEHIGIAVKSLDESIPFFETLLGTKCYAIEEVADHNIFLTADSSDWSKESMAATFTLYGY